MRDNHVLLSWNAKVRYRGMEKGRDGSMSRNSDKKSGTSVVSAVAVDGLIFTALGAWYYIIVLGYGKFFEFLKARRDSKAS
jgi:hypothetical protein